MKPETQSFYEAAVQTALARVVASLDEALDLGSLARGAALSPFHFHRIFRGMVGETPLELQRRLRLERAAFQLFASDTAVTRIAFDAGYESHEAFTRAFRAAFGRSPSEYRQAQLAERARCVRAPQIQIAARCSIHFQPEGSAPPLIVNGGVTMNVEVKQMPELRTATVHHVGAYNRISDAFGRLGELMGSAGLITARPTMLAIYYDDPDTTPESELRSDAALVVTKDSKIPDGLAEQRLPAGRDACTLHVGPYEQLGDAWARFMGQWLPQSGERIGQGTTFEIYLNTPVDVPKQELRTELYIPLA
ncbi:MAG: AraC family transcriptional regulator [Polyangiaceae bacterium]